MKKLTKEQIDAIIFFGERQFNGHKYTYKSYDAVSEIYMDENIYPVCLINNKEYIKTDLGKYDFDWDDPIGVEYPVFYEVDLKDSENGAVSPIDHCFCPAAYNYTADQYVEDCDMNADQEWCDMIHKNEVILYEIPMEDY